MRGRDGNIVSSNQRVSLFGLTTKKNINKWRNEVVVNSRKSREFQVLTRKATVWNEWDYHLVFLVLTSIRKARDDGGDPGSWRNLACIDHDEQLHQVVVDLSRAALHDVDIFSSDRFPNLHTRDEHRQTKQWVRDSRARRQEDDQMPGANT